MTSVDGFKRAHVDDDLNNDTSSLNLVIRYFLDIIYVFIILIVNPDAKMLIISEISHVLEGSIFFFRADGWTN